MASTAAPGYFEEVRLGPHVLQVENFGSQLIILSDFLLRMVVC